jgi:gamma-glutamyltranspeptidase/glutathione hydrolase
MRRLLFIFVLLYLPIGSINADNLSDILSPENYNGISVELTTEEITTALQAKENGMPVLGNDWMIVTANSFASAAGAEILKSGGTAADAMIAAQAVLGLVEPESSGLGGGSFLVWFDSKTNKITTLDGRETAPQSSKMTQFQNKNGDSKKFFDAVIGGLSVGTPGTPALMFETHNRWGEMDWASLFNYAIRLGEEGFPVSKKLQTSIERDSDKLQKIVKTKNYFLPDGVGLKQKQIVRNSNYAETLKKIANDGIEDFYNGSIANDIVDTVQSYKENPGFLNKSDLSNYIVIERDPVCINYREFNVCGMGPPSSGGMAVAQTLKILERYNK